MNSADLNEMSSGKVSQKVKLNNP